MAAEFVWNLIKNLEVSEIYKLGPRFSYYT
jgi:hypothetical protein